jgi:hypothetical protein
MGSSKDKPATDGHSGGYASDKDKATRTRFAIANSRPRDAEARIFFPTRRCANAESATTDRIAHAGLAQIHSERPEVHGFAIVESHGGRFRKSDNSKGNYSGSSLHWKNRLSLSIKKRVRFLMDKGELLLLRKTRLDEALRVNAIHDCVDDV